MLYVDIPDAKELLALRAVRSEFCISIYLQTTPLSQKTDVSRIELQNAVRDVHRRLDKAGMDHSRRDAALGRIRALIDDYEFWRVQANSLAILATADQMHTFRLASHLSPTVRVADRFHLKPLLRAITFPHAAFVLALSQKEVRLVEVFSDLPPATVAVDGLPAPVAEEVDRSSREVRADSGSIYGAEHHNKMLEQYAKRVEPALRRVLGDRDTPLILAATGRIASLYRSANSYSGLLPEGIEDSPDRMSEADLAAAARPILDRAYRAELEQLKELFEARENQGRAATDLQDAARGATFGAIETLLVDMDAAVDGTIDPESGMIHFAQAPEPAAYDVIDEIAGRALATGARVLAVRRADLPDDADLAALLRYPV